MCNFDESNPMKSHHGEKIAPPVFRYHVAEANGLYRPIHFVLVTERMHQEIIAERMSILADTPSPDHTRQQKLFDRYDPALSLRGFQSILSLFGATAKQ